MVLEVDRARRTRVAAEARPRLLAFVVLRPLLAAPLIALRSPGLRLGAGRAVG